MKLSEMIAEEVTNAFYAHEGEFPDQLEHKTAAAITDRLHECVKPLEWDADGRRLRMDDTMLFSKSYDWEGYECFKQEAYVLSCGYMIWPDAIGSPRWNMYATSDGVFVTDLEGEEAAKAAAQAHYAKHIIEGLNL